MSRTRTLGILLAVIAGTALADGPKLPFAGRPPVMRIAGLSLAPGTEVSKDSVIQATLDYEIFEPGEYSIHASVETTNPNRMTDGNLPSSSYPAVTEAKGTLVIDFPLKQVWDLPDVKKPISVWFFLDYKVDERTGRVVAAAGPVLYK